MHVLRGTHRSLAAGGIVLDVHPIPPSGRIESRGRALGRLDESRFFDVVRATEAGMAAAMADGLYSFERELQRDIVERFDNAEELFETADEWENIRLPDPVRRRITSASGPIDLIECVVFRRFRAL